MDSKKKNIFIFIAFTICVVLACSNIICLNYYQNLKSEYDKEKANGTNATVKALMLENEELKKSSEAKDYENEDIVSEYANNCIKLMYTENDTSIKEKAKSLQKLMTKEFYDKYVDSMDYDDDGNGEESNSDGITVSVEIKNTYTKRTDNKNMRLFAECLYRTNVKNEQTVEQTLIVGMDFVYEDAKWKLNNIPFEEFFSGYSDSEY